jgi:hypothetical protein
VKKPPTTTSYAALERQALCDLAAATLADANASPEYVQAARTRLLEPPTPSQADVAALAQSMDAQDIHEVLQAIARWRDRQAAGTHRTT